jgi:hypothetical protein
MLAYTKEIMVYPILEINKLFFSVSFVINMYVKIMIPEIIPSQLIIEVARFILKLALVIK